MERLNVDKPLRVKALYLRNLPPINNCLVCVAYNFLIVVQDDYDSAPTWYNVDYVDKMEGVEQIPDPPETRIEKLGRAVFL